ncbi:MAG: AAA family ATPase [Saprospiraceae bacterium]|nr:AAA family ATPase [Saprospiraceae bacterium]
MKVIFIMGLPGTGKTYLAKLLAARVDAKHISSDVVRKEIGKRQHYEPEDKHEVYREMQARMESALTEGSHVLVDTTFYSNSLRDEFEKLAKRYTNEIFWVLTTADETLIKKRVSKKRPDSEADYQVFLMIRNQWDEVTRPHLLVSTDILTEQELLNKVLIYCDLLKK